MELIKQLEGLVLQAVPTILCVILFYFFLRSQFFGPLVRAMEERARRTEGARREAEESTAAAEKARADYEAALQKARGEVYTAQEAERRKALEERAAVIRAARERGAAFVRTGKAALEVEVAEARKHLERESGALGAEIARALMAGRGPASPRPEASGPGGAA